MKPGREPAWAWFLAGVLAALLWRETRPRASAPMPPTSFEVERALDGRARDDPAAMSPRELRRLPGIGETRALAAARARWEHDPAAGPLLWSDIPGIGPETEARVRSWLAERGIEECRFLP